MRVNYLTDWIGLELGRDVLQIQTLKLTKEKVTTQVKILSFVEKSIINYVKLSFFVRLIYFTYKLMDNLKIFQILHNLITYFVTLTSPKK